MSAAMSATEALSTIPGWDTTSTSLHVAKGGLTNRSYFVERGDDRFILRLDAEHTAAFNLDRVAELEIVARAAAEGIAPEVVFADAEAGILLSRYIPGRSWQVSDLDDDGKLEALAELLHRVHELPPSGERFDPNAVANRYASNLESRPALHAFANRCKLVIAALPVIPVFRCCHNDVVAGNVVSGSALRLLDWEYACDNDPLFDLASLVGFHNLSQERQSVLLNAYAGGHDPELAERLGIQLRLYDAIQWLWLANRQIITRSPAQAARLEELQQRIR